MNKLKPGSVSKIHTTGGPMKLRENIGVFQNAARAYGVSESEVFQAVDLFDKQNILQVTVRISHCFLSLTSSPSRLVMHLRLEPPCAEAELQWPETELSNQITHLRLTHF